MIPCRHCAPELESLRLGAGTAVSGLGHFQQLRKLELALPGSDSQVFLSIASTELREVVIRAGSLGDWWTPSRIELGASADEQLCELVDRLRRMGHRHTLETELRMRFECREVDTSGIDFTAFLPRFREKGIVTIVDNACNRILYSSTSDRQH